MNKPPKTKADLTLKQQRFSDCYDGDLTRSAKTAGISITYASQLLKDPVIKRLIRAREKSRTRKGIATRVQRQEFWTGVLLGEIGTVTKTIDKGGEELEELKVVTQPKMSDRLKASELLGRSEADFTDNLKVEDLNITVTKDN